MIPKIIHYCWFGGKPLPADVLTCIKTWEKFCPDYEIRRWDESNFDVNAHPFVKAAYEAKAWAFVSDYARLKVVYDNGGIYLDTDVELLKSLDFLLENPCYLGLQQVDYLCNTGLGFGAEQGIPILQRMMACYDALSFSSQDRKPIACPRLNDQVVRACGEINRNEITRLEEITVYPCRFFDPVAPGKSEDLLCAESVSIHHYAASWTSGGNQLKRKLIRMFGERRYHQLKKLLGRAN